MTDLTEIRVLGGLHVRRPDGSVVDHAEWRTAKTRDLLRILSVSRGTPVGVDQLLDALWPDVEPAKGRASLRTAASQLRRVLGGDCLERRFSGLVLQQVWVDAIAFETLAGEARRCIAAGDLRSGMDAAREALALYVGDFGADEPYSAWSAMDRERLRALHRELLADASEAALSLGGLREAVRLADETVARELCAERAYRVLMRAHFQLGATEQALRAYEQCRTMLADELGADPSPETQALHLELLSAPPVAPPAVPLTGRDDERRTLRSAVDRALRERHGLLAAVTGASGMGASRLAEEICRGRSERVVAVRAGGPERLEAVLHSRLGSRRSGGDPVAALEQALAAAAPVVVRIDDLQEADAADLTILTGALARTAASVVVVAAVTHDAGTPTPVRNALAGLVARGRGVCVVLSSLGPADVTALVGHLLGGDPSPALVHEVMQRSAGNPAAVLAAVAQLQASGGVETVQSRVVYAGDVQAADQQAAEVTLRQAREALSARQRAVLDAASVHGGTFGCDTLVRLLPELDPEQVRGALDVLEDLAVVVADGAGYRFRRGVLQETAYRWLRPSVRRRLHDAVARSASVAGADRVEHWCLAGEPLLAAGAALQAAKEAAACGRDDEVDDLLERGRALLDATEAAADESLLLLESLADVAAGAGRYDAARAALEDGVGLARRHRPGDLPRLLRKRGDVDAATSEESALSWYEKALTDDSGSVEHARTASAIGAALSLRSPAAAVDVLQEAVDLADRTGDDTARVEARALLAARALQPRREFAEARRWADDAMTLATLAQDDELFAGAVLAGVELLVAVDPSVDAISRLEQARRLADGIGAPDLHRTIALHLCVAYHAVGARGFGALWSSLWPQAQRHRLERGWRWIPARVLVERGEFVAGRAWLDGVAGAEHDVLGSQLVRLTAAQLLAETGEMEQAVALLRAIVDQALGARTPLLLPEAAARLAALTALHDRTEAADHLAAAESTLGAVAHPREASAILLARASLLAAAGEPLAGADLAAAAAGAARGGGLVLQQAAATVEQARHLLSCDRSESAAQRLTEAAALYDRAGAPSRVRFVADLADRVGAQQWAAAG